MALTKAFRVVSVLSFIVLLAAIGFFGGNQRLAHADLRSAVRTETSSTITNLEGLASEIICKVFTELNEHGHPIPILASGSCPRQAQCSDGIDNDGDGRIDAADASCHLDFDANNPASYNPQIDAEDLEPSGPQCSDGIDNDFDGFTDVDDPNCHSDGDATNPNSYVASNDEDGPLPACFDGIDNDGDGLIDLNDPDCSSATDDDESGDSGGDGDGDGDGGGGGAPQCSDGLDNDGDGLVDLDDPDCSGSEDDDESGDNGNGGDGDGDGGGGGPPSGGGGPAATSGGGGGGGTILLRILNEQLRGSSNVFHVTFNTNQAALGWVAYGTSTINSQSMIGNSEASPFYGYPFATEVGTTTDLNHRVTITIPAGTEGDTWYFRPFARLSGGLIPALGRELSTGSGGTPAPETCNAYLNSYIRFGAQNDADDVRRLQIFLKNFEGFSDLAETGVYDEATLRAVHQFQRRHGGDVLGPWGVEESTGFVYITTQKKINEIFCQGTQDFPLTPAQIAEIAQVRALVEAATNGITPQPDTQSQTPSGGTGGGDFGLPAITPLTPIGVPLDQIGSNDEDNETQTASVIGALDDDDDDEDAATTTDDNSGSACPGLWTCIKESIRNLFRR